MTPEIIAAFGAMTAVIGVLWIRLEALNANTQKQLEQCQKDRVELWKELATKK